MTIIRCPRCRDEVTVPAQATSRALVRCPLCLEQYLLAEATSNAPPALVIIGGEVRQDAIAPAAPGDEYRLGAPAPMPEYHPGRVAAATAAATRPALRTSSRTRPRASNPLVLLLNYVGGGLLGLALGLLVLWWGFKRDPLELGPPIARFTPFLVPTQFQGLTATPSDAAFAPVPTSPATSLPGTSSPAPRRKKSRRPSDEPAPREDNSPAEQPLLTQPGLDPAEPSTPSPLAPTIEAPVLTDPAADPASSTPAPPQTPRTVDAASAAIPASASTPASELPEPELTSLLPDDWPSRVVESPPQRQFFAAAELNDAIDRASSTWQQAAGTPADRSENLVQFHADLGEIGRLLSYREPGQTGVAEPIDRVEKLLDAITASGAVKSSFIRFTREQWADLPDGRGLVALGTVQSTASAGDLYTLHLDLGEKQTVPVALTSNPADLCQKGDQLLVIGRVVEEPKTNLPGFEGQLTKLLASGFAYRPK